MGIICMTDEYYLRVSTEAYGLGNEYIGYDLILEKNGNQIFEKSARNIVDLGMLVVDTLSNTDSRVKLSISEGDFYQFGDRLIEKIVGLHNRLYG
jgi:hypothetical protein